MSCRLNKFNERKAERAGWASEVEHRVRSEQEMNRTRPSNPPRFRNRPRPARAEGPIEAQTPSAPSNALLYEGQARGGRAIT